VHVDGTIPAWLQCDVFLVHCLCSKKSWWTVREERQAILFTRPGMCLTTRRSEHHSKIQTNRGTQYKDPGRRDKKEDKSRKTRVE